MLVQFKQLPPTPSTLQTWATLLGTSADDLPTLFDAASALCALPAQVEAAVRKIPAIDEALFLAWRPKVTAALLIFANMSGNSFEAVQQQYDGETLTSLAHSAHELGRSGIELPVDQIAAIATSLRELRDLIEVSEDLDDVLRQFLLDLVAEMERAVRLVRIRGADGLEDALERTVGALAVRYQGKLPEAITDTAIGNKLMAVILQVGALITVVNSSYQLGTAVDQTLRALGH